ncbi:Glycine cleavage system transcriptional activator [Roseovarius albus]|uniref:Glycine cleavage system transcriptional activator n=1 Tax=Roseovarius albus TaxID=1247867 RepID=A0A1X6Y4I4_9RHOB|nr:LysR family transcriptional regulator [Roseovarius albus]SLN10668.1 Glycine cleavage system transcriptional activator [Roseovarius albus]
MNWRNLPPLTALRAFSAFAEEGGVLAAGEQLNVSHAAISQQIRALEGFMGVSLVDRSARQMVLTTEGERLAKSLRTGFGEISHCVRELMQVDANRAVQITATPRFAASWLMPRLNDFQTRHPDINLMINPAPQLTDPSPGGIDVALRFGTGIWPGLDVEMLVPTSMVVVASPSLVGSCDIQTAADLLQFRWLQELGTDETHDWMQSHGVIDDQVERISQMPGNLILDGVLNGQGLTITALSLVRDYVDAGQLQVLFQDEGDTGYHIVTRREAHRSSVKTFLTWLRRQAALEPAKR